MKYLKIIVFLVFLFFCSGLFAVWSNIRNSSYTSDGEIFFQYESTLDISYEHRIYYYQNDEWSYNLFENIFDTSFQSSIPFSNVESVPLSFRIENDSDIYIIPGFTAQQPTSLTQMTSLSEYVRDTAIPDHLNIAGEKMLFSDDRLYFALNNFGGGFPVSGGLFGPFYSYTINLWPAVTGTPPYVYTLLQTVSLAPYVNPGLFKINSATEEMTQIGSITTQVDQNTNTLYLSCLISDLMNDPDFAAAYSLDNGLIITALTQKIEDFGATITIMDEGYYHNVYLQEFILDPFINNIPQIDNIQYIQDGDTYLFSLDYSDVDGHFPIIREIELDTGNTYNFYPASFDFSQTVSFTSQFIDNWSSGIIRFSDNGTDIIEYTISQTVLAAPVVSVEIVGNNVILSWLPVENANSYKVYATIDISLDDWGEPIATTNELLFSESLSDMRFYRVIATTE
ncbi:MAG: hypothetical protein K0B81_05505 [Candidatus Cloacimonetes bacterium]|nr:hypothetical protein [Candidatus Cloacimonadota bacterium]